MESPSRKCTVAEQGFYEQSMEFKRSHSQSLVNASKTEHQDQPLHRDHVQTAHCDASLGHSFSSDINIASLNNSYYGIFGTSQPPFSTPSCSYFPPFIKPLPCWIGFEQVMYLSKMDALTIPPPPLRDALLQCFAEFVHPCMPFIDLHDLLEAVARNDGRNSISLLTFQAIMFSGLAIVRVELLKAAGYTSRRDAQRDFFQRTRLLHDFDYEVDRISLIQSLLLMTYWYETPDDQKDSHHWIGIAISLSRTIGLHRNPERSIMHPKRQRLWKRMWWSMYMRDQLIALGTRRPARIIEEFDVPMLTVEDFQIGVIPAESSCMSASCTLLQDVTKQRELAIICIEKAKLCICLSNVLITQYSVSHNDDGGQSEEGSTRTTMMLMPRKDAEICEVRKCDDEVRAWKENIAVEAEYFNPAREVMEPGDESIILNRSMLHMVYFATLSALHRPQVLSSTARPPPRTTAELPSKMAAELVVISRFNVRYATNAITQIATTLSELDLVKLMPTVGITVLLPAIITHLLEINAPDEAMRSASLQGFCQCIQILFKLRDAHAAADYSTAFVIAAIRKAAIALPQEAVEVVNTVIAAPLSKVSPDGYHPHLRQQRQQQQQQHYSTTPPNHVDKGASQHLFDDDVAHRLTNFLSSTPPSSDSHDEHDHHHDGEDADILNMPDFEPGFDALLDVDAADEAYAFDYASYMTSEGERGAGGLLLSSLPSSDTN